MKKTTKKIAAFLAVAILGTMLLAGCGSKNADSKYVGDWEASRYEYAGFEVSVEDVGESTMELKANGKAEFSFMGTEASGKWEETDDGIEISDSSDTFEMTENEDGELVMEFEEVYFYFEQK